MLKTFTMAQGDSQLPLVYLLLLLLKIYINFLAKQQNSNRPFCTDWRQYSIHGGSIDLSRELELPEDSGYLKVPVEDIYSATNNLNESNCIGEGTAGRVYKAILFDNQHVAVKHIIKDGCMETFLREVRSLTHIRHPNLVALLGYGTNDEECFLIYELCPNGNLAQWLFGMDTALSWIKRLEIAIDSARGLQFLHTYPEGSIIHRDIKPTNILLGKNLEAKLSDFGLSKVIDQGKSYASSEVRGTFGYVDPEYQSNRRVNSAGDIYSFGIVLLQILSGRKVINMNMATPVPLNKIAKSISTREGSTIGFVDPRLHGEYSVEAFEATFDLALACTAPTHQRPCIKEVVTKLEEVLAISMKAKASSPQSTPQQSTQF
nr:probable receptor-like protein kinase At5g18500 [Ipomoea batatas]